MPPNGFYLDLWRHRCSYYCLQMKQQRKDLGEHLVIVNTARTNLMRFINYKTTSCNSNTWHASENSRWYMTVYSEAEIIWQNMQSCAHIELPIKVLRQYCISDMSGLWSGYSIGRWYCIWFKNIRSQRHWNINLFAR